MPICQVSYSPWLDSTLTRNGNLHVRTRIYTHTLSKAVSHVTLMAQLWGRQADKVAVTVPMPTSRQHSLPSISLNPNPTSTPSRTHRMTSSSAHSRPSARLSPSRGCWGFQPGHPRASHCTEPIPATRPGVLTSRAHPSLSLASHPHPVLDHPFGFLWGRSRLPMLSSH